MVAAEVRDLAEQSKESAKEVNHLIKSIQQDTQDTVNVMRKGQQKAVEGKEEAHKANQTFLSIMRDIDKITSQIQEVSANDRRDVCWYRRSKCFSFASF